ncbi:hypothetical protein D3C73_1248690 [compost metagenome]
MARFNSALSNWLASSVACNGSGEGSARIRTASPRVLCSRCCTETSSVLISTGRASSDCRRENASRRWVSAAARWAEAVAVSRKRSRSSTRPMSRRSRTMSNADRMPVSMLLKSWAMPPVSWPIASIFCDCRSAASLASRAAICASSSRVRSATIASSACACCWLLARANLAAVISVTKTWKPSMRPSASRRGE